MRVKDGCYIGRLCTLDVEGVRVTVTWNYGKVGEVK